MTQKMPSKWSFPGQCPTVIPHIQIQNCIPISRKSALLLILFLGKKKKEKKKIKVVLVAVFALAIAGFAHAQDLWPMLTWLKIKGYSSMLEVIRIVCASSYFLSAFWAILSLCRLNELSNCAQHAQEPRQKQVALPSLQHCEGTVVFPWHGRN